MNKFQKTCLQIAKSSILEEFNKKPSPLIRGDSGGFKEFSKEGTCFVTLKKDDELRGCIGSIIPHRTLSEDIKINARNAAFEDPRFPPLSEKELTEKLNIGITILSPIQDKTFKDSSDLFDFLNQEKCGLIIKFGYRQATFLPSVREDLAKAEEFVTHLIHKAGISTDEMEKFFPEFEFQIYYGEEFAQNWDKI